MNRIKRIYYSILSLMLVLHPKGPSKRAQNFGKYHVFGSVGKRCIIQGWRVPLYSNLVFLHNNVRIASNVGFVTHDVIHHMLNHRPEGGNFIEKVGCIEVMNNVFIGSGTRILYNTRIGNNVIIGSGSLVTKDIPDNSVYAGVPAKCICSFDEYVEKHRVYSELFRKKYGRSRIRGVDDELATMIYKEFKSERDK